MELDESQKGECCEKVEVYFNDWQTKTVRCRKKTVYWQTLDVDGKLMAIGWCKQHAPRGQYVP